MMNKQVKMGAILSYLLILMNSIYGIFMTPYIVGCLGEVEYGVYKTIASLGSSLMVLDLGLGGTVTRYIASFRSKKKDEQISNFIAMSLIQAAILCVLVCVVCFFVTQFIGDLYSKTFSSEQIMKAEILFALFAFNMLLHIFENVLYGVIAGYDRFGFGNGMKLLRLSLRILLIAFLLQINSNSIVLVKIDIFLTAVFIFVYIIYIRNALSLRIKFVKWEKSLFLSSGKYTLLMFITSIAAQINNNVDNIIIGGISGPSFVTIYSMGLLIFAMFENLSCSISGVMLPTVSNILEKEDSHNEIQKLIIKVGRIQFLLLGAAVVGFIFLGKKLIMLWLGSGFEDVYIITLVLMIPSLFELCVNVCLSVLRAKNLLIFRTVVLFATTLLNTIITILAVKYWSYIGAAFGTALSFILGSVIIMNIYYNKRLGFSMISIYQSIFSRIWVCLLISGVSLLFSIKLFGEGLLSFIINVFVFCLIYGTTLLLYGLTEEEKRGLPFIRKFFKSYTEN